MGGSARLARAARRAARRNRIARGRRAYLQSHGYRTAVVHAAGSLRSRHVLILALETTSDLCSIAIRDDSGTLVERAFRHQMHLSERLMGDVEELLRDAGVA